MTTWRERIQAARERGYFLAGEGDLAAAWSTCACGEQHAAMPTVVVYINPDPTDWQYCIGCPEDWTLIELGGDFAPAVYADDFGRAEELLDQIEDRVLELKRGARP